ncbi:MULTISPECIES: ATP-dependent Clp protease adapter ClpS [Microbacterium]|uniref:ATP-dependent Clp protease adapter protein ClpS n=2 Tax=Microbacterium TaxID=33882 RepID=A0A150H732_9MICO|nr:MULTISPECIES: ATP-dependent Clp protease adapter ClpS [Microbacterium]EXJ52771.1 Clp protease adaptor protein ClpS [Microbacterium sp. MRS-1]KXZ57871.1 ATP-dependent Clp protease adapter protein ClpS [Microbacterium laevaniformans]
MTIPLEDVRLEERSEVTGPWQTVVWNDPVNLMSYVVHVFRTYFGYTREHAERLMLLVHHEGHAVVAEGAREQMEFHVQAMHDYGLWATVRRADT